MVISPVPPIFKQLNVQTRILTVSKNTFIIGAYDIVKTFYYLSVLTVSFDVFLVANIGFNFRATQVFAIIPIFFGMMLSLHRNSLVVPVGFYSLFIWTLFIVAFIPNTSFLTKSIGYGFWLLFDVLLVLCTVQIFNTETRIQHLIIWYIHTFFLIAIFGLIQFIMPLLHLGAPLVQQWWIPDSLARISGFSYESSFFSTYMLIGWVLSLYLWYSKSALVAPSLLRIIFITISLVMILSSSRMGWLMMLAWFSKYPLKFIYLLANGVLSKKLFMGCVKLTLLLSLLAIIGIGLIGADNLPTLFAGLGLFDDSGSWSADTRLSSANDTLEVFLDSPLLGYSLGGVSSAIGALHGVYVDNIDLAKEYEGNSIFLEVLAASGLIGFIPFTFYIYLLITKPFALSRRLDTSRATLLIGMTLALLFELAILQFNQVILRPYLWLHIAILSALYNIYFRQPYLHKAIDTYGASHDHN